MSLHSPQRCCGLFLCSGVKAIKDPGLIARAKVDLEARTKDQPYASPIPKDAKPPLDMAADAAA